MISKRFLFICLSALILCLSCSGRREDAGPARLRIVTTLFPLYDFTRAVAGTKAEVFLLLPPGMESHSFEPKPDDIIRINKSDLFIFTNRYMEPWAGDIINGLDSKKILVVDASRGVTFRQSLTGEEQGHESAGHHHAERMDPHIWMDFGNAQRMVDNILAAIVAKDPGNRGYYTANASAYKAKLAELDRSYRIGLASCDKKIIFHGGHFALGYLANRYGLRYESAYAVSADSEPTPARIAAMIVQMKANGIDCIFTEELMEPRVARIISQETGAKILKLHGAHNIGRDELKNGATFLSLMEQNLINLRTGLRCR